MARAAPTRNRYIEPKTLYKKNAGQRGHRGRNSGLGSEVTEAAEQLLGRKAIPFRQFAIDERSAWLD
jgi:hypothetical protein